MSAPAREQDVAIALEMAKSASEIALKWFSSTSLDVKSKHDGSPVTQADFEIERCLRRLANEHDPEAAVLGEEEGGQLMTEGRQWIFDPIDGTAAFSRRVPLFSTLIALHDEHGPAVGVVAMPAIGEVVVASRGNGAQLNGNSCYVSKQEHVEGSLLTSWGFDVWPPSLLESLQQKSVAVRGWGDSYSWVLVATGRADAVVDFGVKPWDLAPMRVILSEAGGRFSSPNGTDAIDSGIGVGSNGRIHDELLTVINSASRNESK